MISALREEFSRLFDRDAFASAAAVRGAQERVDSLTRFCRALLRVSSLCMVDGGMRYFDGCIYAPAPLTEVRSTLGDLLIDEGASPSEVRKMGDMPFSVIGERVLVLSDAIAFTNCVFDLRVGVPRPFSREWVVTSQLPYPFDDKARCPRFWAFLSEVLPDGDERDALMEFFALAFVDRTKVSVEKMALLIGGGANGKSVIFEVMKAVFGEDNISTLDPQQLSEDKMTPYLKGKRLNFAPDVRRSAAFDSALKALASGQKVTGRRIFRDAEQVCAPPLAFALNEMPPLRDTTDGFFRRLLVFPFDVSIPEERQDRHLADTIIRDELPGIFNLLLLYRTSLSERGYEFRVSSGMRKALEEIRLSSPGGESPVRMYLKTRGLSPTPSYKGQMPVPVTQGEILLGLRGSVTPSAVTKELARYGVQARRTHAARVYLVYPIQKQ